MGNMAGMMKKVQKMQNEMKKMQDELKRKTVDVTAGGGAVKILRNADASEKIGKNFPVFGRKGNKTVGRSQKPGAGIDSRCRKLSSLYVVKRQKCGSAHAVLF